MPESNQFSIRIHSESKGNLSVGDANICQIYTNIGKYMQIYTNMCKYMQIYANANVCKYIQIYGNICKYMQIYANICQSVLYCSVL